jgi:hypothetical protein
MVNSFENNILSEVQLRACKFFWENAHYKTGLVSDRANNFTKDNFEIASIASTGYALISLPIAVEKGILSNELAYSRALNTLNYLYNETINIQGWYYHFIDKDSGNRAWDSEVSSIDTGILIMGALICGQYFKNSEVQFLANSLYNRIDWQWMTTNDGKYPDKLVLSHGWTPENGFLESNWDTYSEHMFLYLLGMGASKNSLPTTSWESWKRPVITYNGRNTLYGGPIFIHQMSHGFYNFKDQIDKLGWDYWQTSHEATKINREFCINNIDKRKLYSENIWGINACDSPNGYKAFSAPGYEDGTISPTGALSSILFTPDLSVKAACEIFRRYKIQIWGKYGFSNAFNISKNWFDTEVVGIDLGMVLINIENFKTGLIWNLLASHPSMSKSWIKAGFQYKSN